MVTDKAPWLRDVARYVEIEEKLFMRIVTAIAMSDIWVAGIMSDDRWNRMHDDGIETSNADHVMWQAGLRMFSSSPTHWQPLDTAIFHHAPLEYPDGKQRLAMLVSDRVKLSIIGEESGLQVWRASERVGIDRFTPIWIDAATEYGQNIYQLAIVSLLGCVTVAQE